EPSHEAIDHRVATEEVERVGLVERTQPLVRVSRFNVRLVSIGLQDLSERDVEGSAIGETTGRILRRRSADHVVDGCWQLGAARGDRGQWLVELLLQHLHWGCSRGLERSR